MRTLICPSDPQSSRGERQLACDRGLDRVRRVGERGVHRITDRLEYDSSTIDYGIVQQLVMPRNLRRIRLRMLLEQQRAPFHVREEKGDLTLGQVDAAGHEAAIVADFADVSP